MFLISEKSIHVYFYAEWKWPSIIANASGKKISTIAKKGAASLQLHHNLSCLSSHIQVSQNIIISPHKPAVLAPSPLIKTYEYQFDKSPSKVHYII